MVTRPARLILVAPGRLGERIAAALPDGIALSAVERAEPGANPRDPYGIAGIVEKVDGAADGLLLVAPRRRSPVRLTPAAVVGGVPVGIVQADRDDELDPWLDALGRQAHGFPGWAVMAMGQDFYLDLAETLADRMRQGLTGSALQVEDWRADRLNRADLCDRLARGPRLAGYLGHGRETGWSGYQALRWRHIEAVQQAAPAGLIVGFTCDTLKYARSTAPFGCRWVRGGRAAAYLGSTEAVRTDAGARLVELFGALIAGGKAASVGGLLRALDRRLGEDPALADARAAFATFRLMGYPLLPLV
jgi:hypothetical protein